MGRVTKVNPKVSITEVVDEIAIDHDGGQAVPDPELVSGAPRRVQPSGGGRRPHPWSEPSGQLRLALTDAIMLFGPSHLKSVRAVLSSLLRAVLTLTRDEDF